MMKARNVLAIGLGIAGGIIFGGLSGAAKVIQDDAWADLKDNALKWKEERENKKEEESEEA